MESDRGKSNATTLFGMIKIPTVPQIRNIVDGVPAAALSSVFNCVYQALRRDGHLKPFQYLGGLLIALDGTQGSYIAINTSMEFRSETPSQPSWSIGVN